MISIGCELVVKSGQGSICELFDDVMMKIRVKHINLAPIINSGIRQKTWADMFGRNRIYSDREATPGKFLPSSSSREAPPPVDT